MAEISLDLSIEEVLVLAGEVHLPVPSWFAAHELASPIAEAVRRALVARRLVIADDWGRSEPLRPDSESQTFEAVRQLARIICTPAMTVEISNSTQDGTKSYLIMAVPEGSVEQVEISQYVYRYTVFHTEEIPARVKMRAGLAERPLAGKAGVSLQRANLIELLRLVDKGDFESALRLCSSGKEDAASRQLVEALGARKVASTVTVSRFGDGSVVEGGRVSWLDSGDLGLWHVPSEESLTSGDPQGEVEVFPTSVTGLSRDLATLFE